MEPIYYAVREETLVGRYDVFVYIFWWHYLTFQPSLFSRYFIFSKDSLCARTIPEHVSLMF